MDSLLAKIRLQDDEIAQVKGAHAHLVEVLNSKASNSTLPTAKDFLLTGSYARDTKITPLDDVDIFYIIGKANSVDSHWHTIIDCDFTFGQEFLDADENVSSLKILNLIKKEIGETYGKSEIRRDGEVVNLFLTSYGVGFDLTPVFEISNDDYYLMPEGKGMHKWKKSNPLIDHAHITHLHEKHNYMLKDIILLAKYWFKRKRIKSPRSYHLESVAYHLFDSIPPGVYTHTGWLSYLLKNINKDNHLISCPDPTGLSEPLSSGLTPEDITNIENEANEAVTHLSQGSDKFIE